MEINNSPQFEFQKEFLESQKSFPEFITEYDIENSTCFFINLNESETILQILKNISTEYINSQDISHLTKISEKISFLEKNYFDFIKKKYSWNNFPNIIKYFSKYHKLKFIEYIWFLSDSFWKKSEIYDYSNTFYTRRLKLFQILHKIHKN